MKFKLNVEPSDLQNSKNSSLLKIHSRLILEKLSKDKQIAIETYSSKYLAERNLSTAQSHNRSTTISLNNKLEEFKETVEKFK